MNIKIVPGTETEINQKFLQGMADRMAVSFAKYGAVADAYPHKVDACASLLMRLLRYMGHERFEAAVDVALGQAPQPHRRDNGNTEYLMDVGNFAMIEFMRPRHPGAHYAAQDSDTSPGRAWHTGAVTAQANVHRPDYYQREGD